MVTVNNKIITQPKFIVNNSDIVTYPSQAQIANDYSWEPNPIDLEILFEDESLLIINKPLNIAMHPGAGIPDKTIANAILNHVPNNKELPRAGIVHRLDKNTSGC